MDHLVLRICAILLHLGLLVEGLTRRTRGGLSRFPSNRGSSAGGGVSVVGIIFGVLALIVVIVVIIYICYKRGWCRGGRAAPNQSFQAYGGQGQVNAFPAEQVHHSGSDIPGRNLSSDAPPRRRSPNGTPPSQYELSPAPIYTLNYPPSGTMPPPPPNYHMNSEPAPAGWALGQHQSPPAHGHAPAPAPGSAPTGWVQFDDQPAPPFNEPSHQVGTQNQYQC